ncbi:MAG: hypothetical protein M1321_00895 [Candidatus Marsarchaeota archaeon]|jgi:hypothetical protein|nr:hypothetical protein [Candidatus Marsarchaeota archaeon]
MRYSVIVAKKFSYIRSYRILKSTRGSSNPLSRFAQKIVDKYLLKKQSI